MKKIGLLFVVAAFFASGPVGPAFAREKILLIASDYVQADPKMRLANPVSDARKIEEAFRSAGQQDIVLTLEADLVRLNKAIDSFVAGLSNDDVAILYYAGHAIQYQGENYLVSADGTSLLSLNGVVKRVSDASKAAVFLIDACRNNPFEDSGAGRSVHIQSVESATTREIKLVNVASLKTGKGLSQLADLRGLSTIVFFSTEPGNVALDGADGLGSPFAIALTRELRKRQSLDSLLKRTAIGVNRDTDGEQSPWRQGDIPFDIFIAGMKAMAIP